MDIRTKFVFALVSVALASMLALGAITYRSVERELRERTVQQLEGLADSRIGAVEQILAGWHDRVGLVASRTLLRTSLAEYNRAAGESPTRRVRRVLQDALEGSEVFVELRVHAGNGALVAGIAADGARPRARSGPVDHASPMTGSQYDEVTFRGTETPVVSFTAPIVLEGDIVGFLHAVLSAEALDALSRNYQGLGDTGETLVVAVDDEGQIRSLHPVRFPPLGSAIPGFIMNSDEGAARALGGQEARSTGHLIDYRAEPVWVATRFVEETRWGVVVKVDEAEQARPIAQFRNDMIKLAMTLAAFAILFGTILGFRFAQPIHQLAEAANRIREGELDARADIQQEDEVGVLARTFDEMADSLEKQVGLLTEYRLFFDVSVDMMCIASTDGYFKRVNPAFVHELGWPEEELLKRPFVSFVHPDDVQSTMDEIEQLAGGILTTRFENRFICMDGSYKSLRWNTYPEAETGRLYAIARVRTPKPEEEA